MIHLREGYGQCFLICMIRLINLLINSSTKAKSLGLSQLQIGLRQIPSRLSLGNLFMQRRDEESGQLLLNQNRLFSSQPIRRTEHPDWTAKTGSSKAVSGHRVYVFPISGISSFGLGVQNLPFLLQSRRWMLIVVRQWYRIVDQACFYVMLKTLSKVIGLN